MLVQDTLLDVKSEASHLKAQIQMSGLSRQRYVTVWGVQALLQEIQPLVPRLQSGGAKSEAIEFDNTLLEPVGMSVFVPDVGTA